LQIHTCAHMMIAVVNKWKVVAKMKARFFLQLNFARAVHEKSLEWRKMNINYEIGCHVYLGTVNVR
jgi:hypothetical protein